MGSLLYRPTRANWIWLATGGLAVAVATLTGLRLSPPGCVAAVAAATQRAGATHPAGRWRNASLTAPAPGPAAGRPRPGVPGTLYRGRALYYDPGAARGSCLLGPFPPGGLYASLSPRQFARGHSCGTYLTVHGPAGTVTAEVVDLCPSCHSRTVNLSRSAYERIADPAPGWTPVTYQWAADPRLPGPLALRVSAPAPGELAVQVLHHGNRLTSVALARQGTTPGPGSLRLGPGDFWVTRGAGPGQFTLRITDVLGNQALLPRVRLTPGTLIRTRAWLYRPGHRPPASPAPPRLAPAPGRSPGCRR